MFNYILEDRLVNPVPNNEIVSDCLRHGPAVLGVYSQVTAACQHMNVRVLLTGIKDPFLSTIHTRKQIELVIFYCVFDEVFKIVPFKRYTEVSDCYSI